VDCEQARNLFDAYLDGELSAGLETELHAHRLQCSPCRQALALMEVTGHVIASGAAEPKLKADFGDRLLACLEPTLPKRRSGRTWAIRIGGPLAAAACLAMLVGYLVRPEPQVAGVRQQAEPGAEIGTPAERASVEPTSPGLDAAASALQQTLEDTLRDTRQSSASLRRLGEVTLLEIAETLELEALRESESPDAEWPDEMADEDAVEVEEL
jgi:hypothetical protein